MTDEMTAIDDARDENGPTDIETAAKVAPPSVTISHGADLESMSASGRRLHVRRFDLVALILAVPALWLPGWWLCAALVIYFVLLVYRYVAKTVNLDSLGPATFLVVPFRLVVGILFAIPRVVLVAVGALLAMVLGFLAVGVVAGLLGMAFGFLLHHDSGDLLLADFKATGLAWGPQFGLFAAAYLMTRAVILHATSQAMLKDEFDESEAEELEEPEHSLTRTLVDQIGEVGLVALVVLTALAVAVFSFFSPSVWSPFGGYRGVTGFVHLRTPAESTLNSQVASDVKAALGACSAQFTYLDETTIGNSTTLTIVFAPANGTSQSADGALIAARITNRLLPVVDVTYIKAATPPTVSERLPSSQYRTAVFRSVADAGAALIPPVQDSAELSGLDPLLKNCSS